MTLKEFLSPVNPETKINAYVLKTSIYKGMVKNLFRSRYKSILFDKVKSVSVENVSVENGVLNIQIGF